MSNLTPGALQDAIQTAINATSLWYGTSDVLTPGKVLVSTKTSPPFVIVHPDDVERLGPGWRHLREYRPTAADRAEQARQWFEERLEQPIEFHETPREQFLVRRRWSI